MSVCVCACVHVCVCVCLSFSVCLSVCACVCVLVCVLVCVSLSVCPLTQLPGCLDVYVVVAAADADDDAQSLELLQVLTGQRDGVVHHGAHRLVQHLVGRGRRSPLNLSHTLLR